MGSMYNITSTYSRKYAENLFPKILAYATAACCSSWRAHVRIPYMGYHPSCAGAMFERLAFEMVPTFQKQVFKKQESFCCDIALYPTYPPKASLQKDFRQRGWAAERPAPFVGGGRRPPPLWRLAFGGYLAMSLQKDCHLKGCLLKCGSHAKRTIFQKRILRRLDVE